MLTKRTITIITAATVGILTLPGVVLADSYHDTNRDGRIDYMQVDQNRDGVNDWAAQDRNHDGRYDTIFINTYIFGSRQDIRRPYEYVAVDTNGDGRPEYGRWDRVGDERQESYVQFVGEKARYVWRDADFDGRYELGEYDANGDWVFEWTMIDANSDGVADRWVKTSSLVPRVSPMAGYGVVAHNNVNTTILNGIFGG